MNKPRRFLWALLAGVCAATLNITILSEYADRYIEPLLGRYWFLLRGPVQPPPEVIVVKVDDRTYDRLKEDPRYPLPRRRYVELLEALAAWKVRGVAFDLFLKGADRDSSSDEALAQAMRRVPAVLSTYEGPDGTMRPLELFRAAAEMEATSSFPADLSGLRRFPFLGQPSLGEAGARFLRDVALPGKSDLINFYGPGGTIASYSLSDVLQREDLAPDFRDKVVFVGYEVVLASTDVEFDSFASPFGKMYGVEIHASNAANLLSADWIKSLTPDVEYPVLSAIVFLGAFAVFVSNFLAGAAIYLGLAGLGAIFCYQAFLRNFYFSGLVTASAVLLLALIVRLIWHLWVTHRSRNEIRRVLSRVVAKPVMAKLLKDPLKLNLGGERSELTIMFTDIAGFSGLAEKTEDEALFALVSRYFSELNPITMQEGGAVLHFVADSLVIIWGAPLPAADGPDRAMRTAVAIQRKVQEFCAREGISPLKTRIGIHHGMCAVGNFGAEDHFAYTAIGDQVNIAARLEGLNKVFGSPILISRQVRDRLHGPDDSIRLGVFSVPGRKAPTELYANFLKPISAQAQNAWRDAWESFCKKEWDKAAHAFRLPAGLEPVLNTAAEFYLRQISLNRVLPPPPGWQGEIGLEKDEKKIIDLLLERVISPL